MVGSIYRNSSEKVPGTNACFFRCKCAQSHANKKVSNLVKERKKIQRIFVFSSLIAFHLRISPEILWLKKIYIYVFQFQVKVDLCGFIYFKLIKNPNPKL